MYVCMYVCSMEMCLFVNFEWIGIVIVSIHVTNGPKYDVTVDFTRGVPADMKTMQPNCVRWNLNCLTTRSKQHTLYI